MVKKLNELGININIEEVKRLGENNYIGRPHIARVLIDKGYVADIPQAFHKYLGIGKLAYVDRYRITIKDTISLINDAGGFAVLAHPGLLKNKDIISYCISAGIQGLECFHPNHSKNDTKFLLNIANLSNLAITGGSDFHGDINSNNRSSLGKYFVDLDIILQMEGMI